MRISDWSSDVCSSDLPFAIIDLRADHDRQELAARMFIGVAKRQEGQENLFVADAEVVDENFGGARGIVQDRAMMLHHAARRAAGAAGIDQAGGVLALDAEAARLDFLKISLAAFDQRRDRKSTRLNSSHSCA